MSILINGIDFPKRTPMCLVIDAAGQAKELDLWNEYSCLPELYEAVSIPPGVDLIDRNDAIMLMEWKRVGTPVVDLIKSVPSVIPKERDLL